MLFRGFLMTANFYIILFTQEHNPVSIAELCGTKYQMIGFNEAPPPSLATVKDWSPKHVVLRLLDDCQFLDNSIHIADLGT